MVDADLIFDKFITIYNEPAEFSIKQGEAHYSLSKDAKPVLSISNKKNLNGKSIECYGILGVLVGYGTDYLIVITKVQLISLFFKSRICKIDKIDFLPFDTKSDDHFEKNKENLKMIEDFLNYSSLYFSNIYDLSATVTDNINTTKIINNKITRSQFCWNSNFINSIIYKDELEIKNSFIFPVINGFISDKLVSCYEKEFNFMLISRRDVRRSGMRFIKRGLDSNGCASNFVESEQIIYFPDEDRYNVLSYLQIRGSIPLIWSQPSQLKFVPHIITDQDYQKQSAIFKKHLYELNINYGNLTLVNLIDKKGDQKIIGEIYENISNNIKEEFEHSFVWFDFHDECKKMKYENLNKLLKKNTISSALINYNFTHLQLPSTYSFASEDCGEDSIITLSQQTGIFRTNCIDSLDRTNVVQTLFARNLLNQMLSHLKLKKASCSGDAFEPFISQLEKTFRMTWADNGDYISKMYSGTPAQKGDFTRLGRRTTTGAFSDLLISARRFYLNNFNDGYRQDCHDFFLGNISPFKFKKRNSKKYFKLFLLSVPTIIIVFYFVITNNMPNKLEITKKPNLIFQFLGLVIPFILSAKFLFNHLIEKMYDTPSS